MRVLVLGGTHHVGRAFVSEALARGHAVTTVSRGVSGEPAEGAVRRTADRAEPGSLTAALADGEWDLAVDTWSGAPAAVGEAARALAGRVGHLTYISSRSVYTWPWGRDEDAEVVDGDPESTDTSDYAAVKRGGELAAQAFDGPLCLARAGLILGPWERVGRLPWWLGRVARGGRVPAPGTPDRPLQHVDARDVAAWVLDHRPVGVFNTVSRPGHATWGEVLDTCLRVTGADAELVWLGDEVVERAGVEPWTQLPIWTPMTGELAGVHGADTSRAAAAGLSCRPIAETVRDTWAWLQEEGWPESRVGTGLDDEAEARLWAASESGGPADHVG